MGFLLNLFGFGDKLLGIIQRLFGISDEKMKQFRERVGIAQGRKDPVASSDDAAAEDLDLKAQLKADEEKKNAPHASGPSQ